MKSRKHSTVIETGNEIINIDAFLNTIIENMKLMNTINYQPETPKNLLNF